MSYTRSSMSESLSYSSLCFVCSFWQAISAGHLQNDVHDRLTDLQLQLFREQGLFVPHVHATTLSRSGGATCLTPVTGWGLPSSVSQSQDDMSTEGGWSLRAAFQIITCKWHLSRCCVRASSVGGRVFMLGVVLLEMKILCWRKLIVFGVVAPYR